MTSPSDDHPIPATPHLQGLTPVGYQAVHPGFPTVGFGAAPWPTQVIPAADLSADMRLVRDALTAMSTKLDTFHEASNRVQQDHEARLRALESRSWPLPAATVAIALTALLVTAAAALLPLVLR
ncbi:hypothetical protein ACFQ8C_20195 [Streptomyces sp. NPDC056503]|uniref:hypothetical protein n=1 Tax=Streptomyces sp. NPDC056503 TaxID=3345842 RepID=UPI0036787D35